MPYLGDVTPPAGYSATLVTSMGLSVALFPPVFQMQVVSSLLTSYQPCSLVVLGPSSVIQQFYCHIIMSFFYIQTCDSFDILSRSQMFSAMQSFSTLRPSFVSFDNGTERYPFSRSWFPRDLSSLTFYYGFRSTYSWISSCLGFSWIWTFSTPASDSLSQNQCLLAFSSYFSSFSHLITK